MDQFKPEYNILTKPGSLLGFKHFEQKLSKYKQGKLTDDPLHDLNQAKLGATLSGLAKTNRLLAISHIITAQAILDFKNPQTNLIKQWVQIKKTNNKQNGFY